MCEGPLRRRARGLQRCAAGRWAGSGQPSILGWQAEGFCQGGWIKGQFLGKGEACQGFLAKLPKYSNILGCSAAAPFPDSPAGLEELSPDDPSLAGAVALEGCAEVADCSDKAYPVTQAVCRRMAFAQRSPCRSQFGCAQPAGLNVPLLLSPAWRKSATRVMVYSYTCTRLSFLNSLLIKYKNFSGDGGDGMPGHPWLSLQVWSQRAPCQAPKAFCQQEACFGQPLHLSAARGQVGLVWRALGFPAAKLGEVSVGFAKSWDEECDGQDFFCSAPLSLSSSCFCAGCVCVGNFTQVPSRR